MIKYDQQFYQWNILIKTAKPLLILLSMADSNQPHMDKLWFILIVFDDHIMMSMPELNNEGYFITVTELEDEDNYEFPGDYYPPKYLSDNEYVSNNEDGIPSQDNNQLRWKILAVWERYIPILENDYSRAG